MELIRLKSKDINQEIEEQKQKIVELLLAGKDTKEEFEKLFQMILPNFNKGYLERIKESILGHK